MKILYIGQLLEGSTCLQRMKAMQALGHEVLGIDTVPCSLQGQKATLYYRVLARIVGPVDQARVNSRMLAACMENRYDVVWVDKGVTIRRETLQGVKEESRDTILVHYNPDDPFTGIRALWRRFLKSAPLYDVHFVPRDQNLAECRSLGCRNVHRFERGFDPVLRRPLDLSPEDRVTYRSDVCFIGAWRKEREDSIFYLIEKGVPVSIWGDHWERGRHWNSLKPVWRGPSIYGQEYTKAICGAKICLCFLNKKNRDQQNSRTFEIPACGAFMLAERTAEHMRLFEEGKEAEFFSSDEELLEKVKYYLAREDLREQIGKCGRQRCLSSGYSHQDRIRQMLGVIEQLHACLG